jgi:hypothetical protein
MTRDQTRHESKPDTDKPERPHKPQAPWPDQDARQEMSEAAVERDNLGKHGKNPGWDKKW